MQHLLKIHSIWIQFSSIFPTNVTLTYSQVKLRSYIDRLTLPNIGRCNRIQCSEYSSWRNFGEFRSKYLDIRFNSSAHIDYFKSNIFTFAITIRPYDKTSTAAYLYTANYSATPHLYNCHKLSNIRIFTSLSSVFLILMKFSGHIFTIGASNNDIGSTACQCRYESTKSCVIRWPDTDVITISAGLPRNVVWNEYSLLYGDNPSVRRAAPFDNNAEIDFAASFFSATLRYFIVCFANPLNLQTFGTK